MATEECPEPLYELSLIYETGIPPLVLSDEDHARSLLIEAAELSYPPAQYRLGFYYEHGKGGFPLNHPESIRLYLLSAKSGYAEAQLALAGWYLSGCDSYIPKSDSDAFYYAMEAAQQKLSRAEYTIGYFYELGIGIPKNTTEALKWYVIAARNGDELALQRLKEVNVSLNLVDKQDQTKSEKKKGIFGFIKRHTIH